MGSVWLVFREGGEWSDHYEYVEFAHATRDGAVSDIESRVVSVHVEMPSLPPDEMGDPQTMVEFRHPVRQDFGGSATPMWSIPTRDMDESWAPSYDDSWFIEEVEVEE